MRVLAITGAGVSAASGIPTFRGAEGYWRRRDPSELATASAFDRDPAVIWEWYRERRQLVRERAPNNAHVAITRLGLAVDQFLLVTQNVDRLHERAVFDGQTLDPRLIVPIHGDLFVTRCERCTFERRDDERDEPGVPRCPRCGARLRPGVVWFDEELDQRLVDRVDAFIAGGAVDVVIVAGTTAGFDYIQSWALRAARPPGRLIEINLSDTPLSSAASEIIRAPAAAVLPELVDQILLASKPSAS